MKPDIVTGYLPGCLGRITEMHAAYYHPHAGFGFYFEEKVAAELAQFLRRYDSERDGIWLVVADGRIEGSIAIDGTQANGTGAHLRWFIMSERLRGNGCGKALLEAAIGFCKARQYERIRLWTFAGLAVARHLYDAHGFRLVMQQQGAQWGTEVTEQCFELTLLPPAGS